VVDHSEDRRAVRGTIIRCGQQTRVKYQKPKEQRGRKGMGIEATSIDRGSLQSEHTLNPPANEKISAARFSKWYMCRSQTTFDSPRYNQRSSEILVIT